MKIKAFLIIMMLILTSASLFGQTGNEEVVVFGLVTDLQKKPISGANILVDGEETYITTDDKGYFKLSVKPGSDSISVVALNYPVGISAISEKPIIFRLYSLSDSTTSLQLSKLSSVRSVNDVPVSHADSDFSLQKSKLSGIKSVNSVDGQVDNRYSIDNSIYGMVDETASISIIDGRNRKYDSYTSIFDMLRGTAGVYVRGTQVSIRGAISFNPGANQPLFLVNGIQWSIDEIESIMPSSVKQIQVIKGPSASIYGTRGAAGVISITLK